MFVCVELSVFVEKLNWFDFIDTLSAFICLSKPSIQQYLSSEDFLLITYMKIVLKKNSFFLLFGTKRVLIRAFIGRKNTAFTLILIADCAHIVPDSYISAVAFAVQLSAFACKTEKHSNPTTRTNNKFLFSFRLFLFPWKVICTCFVLIHISFPSKVLRWIRN